MSASDLLLSNAGYVAGGYLVSTILHQYYKSHKQGQVLRLPPTGPEGENGTEHDFPYLFYDELARELESDIIHVKNGERIVVVLNSIEAVDAVLEQRSSIYSNRVDDAGAHWALSKLPYDEILKRNKTLLLRFFHPSNRRLLESRQESFVRGMLLPLLCDGHVELKSVVRNFVVGLALSTTYGIRVKSTDDEHVALVKRVMASSTTPKSDLGAYRPTTKHSSSWFKSNSDEKAKSLEEEFKNKPFEAALRALRTEKSESKPCFVSEALNSLGTATPSTEQLNAIRDVAASVIYDGTETTAAAIESFFHAMPRYPSVQRKAQAEIIRVLGRGRMPTLEDRDELPYITALVKEVLRWQPPSPTGLPHVAAQHDDYNGYVIPAGSIVLGNVWAILHNEHDYPDPDTFAPERFLHPNGQLNKSARDPATIAFGFGRRACPGKNSALSTLWIVAASVLAAFTIEPGCSDRGKPIEPVFEYLPGAVRRPAPFKVTMKARSPELAEHLLKASERAECL